MKNSLENSIKQSLENYELPFNAEAWSAMSSKLDASVPVNGDASSLENTVKSSLENYELPYAAGAWTALNAKLDASSTPGVDQAIKSSLENYELPYAAGAWTALSAKLDAKPASNAKWYIAATALIAVAAASYFIITNQSEDKNDTSKSVAQITNTKENTINAKPNSRVDGLIDSNQSNGSSTSNGDQSSTNSNVNNTVDNTNGNVNGNTVSNSGSNQGNGTTPPVVQPTVVVNPSPVTPTPIQVPALTDTKPQSFIMPSVSNVCEGESIQIENENAYNLTIVYPNGAMWTGKGKSKTTLSASTPGTYQVGYLNAGKFTQEGTFNANEAPSADFSFVDLGEILLDGLPTTEVESSSMGRLEWKFGKQTANGNAAAAHFFKKGNHDIELTVTDNNGCQSTMTKSVSIDKDYNLIATKAFDPRSLDSRNNTFIPNGLVERENVKFAMIIIDPTDGHVMYETSDASAGWDGIDRRNGEMVDYQKSFIWKVSIENPEQGEKSVYSDDAVIIPRQN